VLAPVRDTGFSGGLIFRADAIPHPGADERGSMDLFEKDLQTVGEIDSGKKGEFTTHLMGL
jgi:hypothetical protein